MEEDAAESEERLRQAYAQTAEVLTKPVIPLYELNHRGRPKLFGSGFLVRSANLHFVVSAAHVLERLRTTPLHYYVAPDTLRKLSGRALFNHFEGDRERDPIDVGVLRLSPEAPPPYPAIDKWAIDLSYLRPSPPGRTGKTYLLGGYPASQNDANPVARSLTPSAYTYRSQSINLDRYAKLGLDPARTLALPLDLKVGFDQNGKHRNFPKPQGMSGSPVWMLLDENEEHSETSKFSIVGVATKYRRSERVLLASDISEAVRMIEVLTAEAQADSHQSSVATAPALGH